MELPKNITQIGESDRNCKIYVEDYVVSYIKQINQLAVNKEMAVALYGARKTEGMITYLFIYGGAKLDFLQREVRHLSQAQCQETERIRQKYFPENEFLGYCLLTGEMVEGFHICEQGICRYVAGYAQFYEKNDSMLAYMLDVREEAPQPEVVDREKYDMVKRRQEERREEPELQAANREERRLTVMRSTASHKMRGMRVATLAVFGVLCLAALSTLGDGQVSKDWQDAARQAMSSLTEQKIPDAEESLIQNAQANTLVAEEKLTEALQEENAVATTGVEQMVTTETVVLPEPSAEPTTATPSPAPEATPTPSPEATPTPEETMTPAPTPAPTAEPVAYIIREGDTLIGICISTYGSDARLAEICSLNQISDADDIKVDQKILLP
ncbi:MAG: hypothetical protein E7291_07380 [Lachnospiraceae bacterium]|nr:hypothetical protein [Lachnospiraceae bacterium]